MAMYPPWHDHVPCFNSPRFWRDHMPYLAWPFACLTRPCAYSGMTMLTSGSAPRFGMVVWPIWHDRARLKIAPTPI